VVSRVPLTRVPRREAVDYAMGVGIIGCGLIGRKRARALATNRLVACADVDFDRARALAEEHPGAEPVRAWKDLIVRDDVHIVVVATTHDALPEIALAAVLAGKHVLLEKPAARRPAELDPVIQAAAKTGARVHVGFNHRYHPAILRAKALADGGSIGPLLYVRGRYGHGGRLGYEKEWRARPEKSGGGELIDQGIHLVDLARWFLGDFVEVHGFAPTYFWDMPVEDNAFMLLRTAAGTVAQLHASWTEWKNLFSLEIFGRTGKLEVTGLGGSYGTERLVHYAMRPEMGPPDVESWEFAAADESWKAEFVDFEEDVRMAREPSPGLADARAALEIVAKIYHQRAPGLAPPPARRKEGA
jgi:predicted dehydrogenase